MSKPSIFLGIFRILSRYRFLLIVVDGTYDVFLEARFLKGCSRKTQKEEA